MVTQNSGESFACGQNLQALINQQRLTDALQLLERFGHYGEQALTVIRLTQLLGRGAK